MAAGRLRRRARDARPVPSRERSVVEQAAGHRGRSRARRRSLIDASPSRRREDGDGADDEGARLIALNMVMNGTPREEIDRYLAENFRLTDRRGLLDEVYSSFEN